MSWELVLSLAVIAAFLYFLVWRKKDKPSGGPGGGKPNDEGPVNKA